MSETPLSQAALSVLSGDYRALEENPDVASSHSPGDGSDVAESRSARRPAKRRYGSLMVALLTAVTSIFASGGLFAIWHTREMDRIQQNVSQIEAVEQTLRRDLATLETRLAGAMEVGLSEVDAHLENGEFTAALFKMHAISELLTIELNTVDDTHLRDHLRKAVEQWRIALQSIAPDAP